MRPTCLFLATLVAAAALPLTALATVSIAGGGYVQNTPSASGAAFIISTGQAIPAFPLEIQFSGMVPWTRTGGYAATAEIRGFTGGGYGGAYIGAGGGFGNISTNRSTGTVVTVFAGKPVAPYTAIEIRLYKQTQDTGATAGFLGLRLSF